MNPPCIGSLFSGYGGLDMAVAQVFPSSSLVWHCEYDDAPARILAHHYPDVPNYRDVTTIDWATMPPIDILTGGYPCQPFSAAGRRKGTDDERHLWPYVREAIRHLRPRYTFLENVAGHRTLGFDRVLGDMAEDGLHVRWCSLRASDVGAPHHRERLFILVTDPEGSGSQGNELAGRACEEIARPLGDRRIPADADRGECDRNERAQGRSTLGRDAVAGRGARLPAHPESERRETPGLRGRSETPQSQPGRSVGTLSDSGCQHGGPWSEESRSTASRRSSDEPERHCTDASDADGIGFDGRAASKSTTGTHETIDRRNSRTPDAAGVRERLGGFRQGTGAARDASDHAQQSRTRSALDSAEGFDWGPYADAVRRWERLTRRAPSPTELNKNGKPRLSAAFAEWMMGLPAGWVTDPAIDISRIEQLKAIGNGVVPQQAATAYAHLLSLDVIQIQYEVIP